MYCGIKICIGSNEIGETSEINSHMLQLIFNKSTNLLNEERVVFLTFGDGRIVYPF